MTTTTGLWKQNPKDKSHTQLDSRPEPQTSLQLMVSKGIPVMIDLDSRLLADVSKKEIFNEYLALVGVKNTNATELFIPRKKDIADITGYSASYPETFLEYLPLPWYHRQVLVCWVFQKVRDAINAPISIYNSYRPGAYNKAVGGAAESDHISATAIDMSFRNRAERKKAQAFLEQFRKENKDLKISLGIGDTKIHLGVNSPKGERTWYYSSYVP